MLLLLLDTQLSLTFLSDDACTSGQLVIASRESQYKILHFHHAGLDKLVEVFQQWRCCRETQLKDQVALWALARCRSLGSGLKSVLRLWLLPAGVCGEILHAVLHPEAHLAFD